jgi:hypothetical protein
MAESRVQGSSVQVRGLSCLCFLPRGAHLNPELVPVQRLIRSETVGDVGVGEDQPKSAEVYYLAGPPGNSHAEN